MDTISKAVANGGFWPEPTGTGVINNSRPPVLPPPFERVFRPHRPQLLANDRVNARWSQKYQSK